MSFKACVSLLIFCLDCLFIGISGVLKFPTIIVLLLISLLMAVSILPEELFLCWVASHRLQTIFIIVMFSSGTDPLITM